MLDIPAQLKKGYARLLTQRDIPPHSHGYYLPVAPFYLDFWHTYHHDPTLCSALPLFLRKLQEKNQPARQQKQASPALALSYPLENDDRIQDKGNQTPMPHTDGAQESSMAVPPEKNEGWSYGELIRGACICL